MLDSNMLHTLHDRLLQLWAQLDSIKHLGVYLYLAWIMYLVLLGTWIVLQKREPAATLSWLFSLALLPYFGFVVYHLFGPQRIHRQRLRRAGSRIGAEAFGAEPRELQDNPEALELSRLAKAVTGLGPTTARDVRLLIDGHAKYTALIADIAQAQQHVHLEYYIYTPDESGRALRDALLACARRGVRVRLLLDAMGSSKINRHFFADLVAAGGELVWFHPTKFLRFWYRPWLNLRTHRKIAVIDNRIGYVGGINITDEENESLRADAYRDLHLRVEGDVVRSLQLVFVEDWVYACGRRDLIPEIVHTLPPTQLGGITAQVLTSGPDSSWEAIHRLHVSLIHGAHRRVWLVTPYFVPGEAAMMALTSAALGGLDVRLLVPKHSDSRLVTSAASSYFDDLITAGVKIYEYGPRMLHTKALLIDESTALFGSANFDNRSFRLNFEVMLMLTDTGIAEQLAKLIKGEFANAPRVRGDRPKPLLRTRLPEALARLLSPLL